MRSKPKTKLSFHNRLDWVQFMTKKRVANDVVDLIGLVYSETEIELWGLIWLGMVYDEN